MFRRRDQQVIVNEREAGAERDRRTCFISRGRLEPLVKLPKLAHHTADGGINGIAVTDWLGLITRAGVRAEPPRTSRTESGNKAKSHSYSESLSVAPGSPRKLCRLVRSGPAMSSCSAAPSE